MEQVGSGRGGEATALACHAVLPLRAVCLDLRAASLTPRALSLFLLSSRLSLCLWLSAWLP